MNNIVVTGADGFIGSHLVRCFSERGLFTYAIVAPGSRTTERLNGIGAIRIFEAAPRDYYILSEVLPQAPTAFLHLAWAGVSPESRDSTKVQFENVDFALNAVQLAGALRAERFILPGSTMEYAYCDQKINETACPSPQNAYGAAKIAARYLCAALCEELGVPYIYSVITGIYSADRMDNNVIYYTIRELLKGGYPHYTKLEQLWDYIYIDDLVNAFYLIATKGKGGAFYSVGHGDNWALVNYIYQIRDAIDPTLPLGVGDIPYKDGRLPSSCIDLHALQRDTGFVPKVPFCEGIRKVIARVRERQNASGSLEE